MRYSVALNGLVPLEVQEALGVLLTGGVPILDGEEVGHSGVDDIGVAYKGLLHSGLVGGNWRQWDNSTDHCQEIRPGFQPKEEIWGETKDKPVIHFYLYCTW